MLPLVRLLLLLGEGCRSCWPLDISQSHVGLQITSPKCACSACLCILFQKWQHGATQQQQQQLTGLAHWAWVRLNSRQHTAPCLNRMVTLMTLLHTDW